MQENFLPILVIHQLIVLSWKFHIEQYGALLLPLILIELWVLFVPYYILPLLSSFSGACLFCSWLVHKQRVDPELLPKLTWAL